MHHNFDPDCVTEFLLACNQRLPKKMHGFFPWKSFCVWKWIHDLWIPFHSKHCHFEDVTKDYRYSERSGSSGKNLQVFCLWIIFLRTCIFLTIHLITDLFFSLERFQILHKFKVFSSKNGLISKSHTGTCCQELFSYFLPQTVIQSSFFQVTKRHTCGLVSFTSHIPSWPHRHSLCLYRWSHQAQKPVAVNLQPATKSNWWEEGNFFHLYKWSQQLELWCTLCKNSLLELTEWESRTKELCHQCPSSFCHIHLTENLDWWTIISDCDTVDSTLSSRTPSQNIIWKHQMIRKSESWSQFTTKTQTQCSWTFTNLWLSPFWSDDHFFYR